MNLSHDVETDLWKTDKEGDAHIRFSVIYLHLFILSGGKRRQIKCAGAALFDYFWLYLQLVRRQRGRLCPKKNNIIMTQQEKTTIEERIVDVLKTVYDPEIPVNIYDLGLIYRIEVADDGTVEIDMTFTAPSCPAADFILEDVRQKVDTIEKVKSAQVNLVFEPVWDQSMMSEEARVELGFD